MRAQASPLHSRPRAAVALHDGRFLVQHPEQRGLQIQLPRSGNTTQNYNAHPQSPKVLPGGSTTAIVSNVKPKHARPPTEPSTPSEALKLRLPSPPPPPRPQPGHAPKGPATETEQRPEGLANSEDQNAAQPQERPRLAELQVQSGPPETHPGKSRPGKPEVRCFEARARSLSPQGHTKAPAHANLNVPLRPQQLLLHQLQKQVEQEQHVKKQDGATHQSAAAVHEEKAQQHCPPPLMQAAAAAAAAAKQAEDAMGAFLPARCLQGVRRRDPPAETNEVPEAKPGKTLSEEGVYLRRNIENLRQQKRNLQRKVENMEARVRAAEAQKDQYKTLFEESQHENLAQASGEGRDLEITGLHQQLAALLMLKDALNSENLELQDRIQGLEQVQRRGQASCVICMENLANIVCLPCRHLALCSFCSQQAYADRSICPLCRGSITERMQIFMP